MIVRIRRRIFVLTTPLLLSLTIGFAQPRPVKTGVEAKIDSIIALMTVEEKCGQLNQLGMPWKDGMPDLSGEIGTYVRNGLMGTVLGATGAEGLREIQRVAITESRLKIPMMFGADVIHGFRTVFPVPLAEACTWDPDLVEEAARIAAFEASAAGVHWTYAPMVDIARDPRWGRIVEGSGEDPYLGSVMAAARVRGFQGIDVTDPTRVLATAKHFAAYGAAEAGRDYNTVDMSERTLREVYLPPFKAAIDAGAGSLMSAFNEIAGVPSTASKLLMTHILRDEWKFDGLVVSDYDAVGQIIPHGTADSRAQAGLQALTAGTDIDMMSKIYLEDIPRLVRSGQMREEIVNESVRRVLRQKFRIGLFTDPYRGISVEREKKGMLRPEHLAKALDVARKSIVLLKNEKQLLPLSKSIRTLAVIGPLGADKHNTLGPWHASGRGEDVVTVLDGIKSKASGATQILFHKGCEIDNDSVMQFTEAVAVARRADAVVLVLGESERMSGEAGSRSDINLPSVQRKLLDRITQTGKPVVLVLMNGRPLTIGDEVAKVGAVLETWFLGIQAGNAIADVLFGDVNPSGKLTVTFPRNVGQIPIYYNHKNTGRPFTEPDKYTSRYLDVPNTPLFAFGFGLSYTSFSYLNLTLDAARIRPTDSVRVRVEVRNTGKYAGDEVVQLYIQDLIGSVTRPVKELRRFKRVSLKPGERRNLTFTLSPEDLMMYNAEMKRVVEPGQFKVFIGGNSVDCIETQFEVLE